MNKSYIKIILMLAVCALAQTTDVLAQDHVTGNIKEQVCSDLAIGACKIAQADTPCPSVLQAKQPLSQASQPLVTAKLSENDYSTMAMISIPSGCFQMGSNKYNDEKPVHPVCLSAYEMGKYEVTQAQWQQVMGDNPSYFKHSNHPVEQVSWDEVQEFIRKLNQQTGQHYRLPTEAEWEYACRSGGKEQNYCGSGSADSVGWYDINAGGTTHKVGQKQANELGLYDMSGNVWEWVQDWYDGDYYCNSPSHNPKGAADGSFRVLRGGSWFFYALYLRSTNRLGFSPDNVDYYLGFRLARTR